MKTNLAKNRVFLTIIISMIIMVITLLLKDSFYTINEDIKGVIIRKKNEIILNNENTVNEMLNKDIVVVTIDEDTLNRFGFPFSRREYIPLINNLNSAGAEIIGFDVIFANDNPGDIEGDDLFASSITNAGNIILGAAIIQKDILGENQYVIEKPLDKLLSGTLTYGYYRPNVDYITNVATSFRPMSERYDSDGNFLVFNHFAIKILKAYYSKIYEKDFINFEKEDNEFYYLREDYQIPFMETESKDVLINYIPLPNRNEDKMSRFPTYSFIDIYDGNFEPNQFDGKIVLIGATAKGLKDTFNTPNGIEYGVYIQANIINTILTKNYLLLFNKNLELVLIFLLILLSVYFNLSRSGYVLIFSNIAIAIIFLIIFPLTVFIVFASYLLNYLFQLIFALLISLIISNIVKYILENKDKTKLNDALSEYVSKDIADEIISNEGNINLNGERKKLAIYFSDIEGFTSISEKLNAEELVSFLRDFLTYMSDIIMDEKGFINKYEGDAIMALWGAFLGYNNSSFYACSSALKQQELLKELNTSWKKSGIPEIKIRIGINVGEAIVGNIGSKGRKMEFTALGDSINLASRLEGVNKFYGTYICISESVYIENKDKFEFRYLDTIRVKGKDIPVKIYELLGFKGEISNEKKVIIKDFEKARKLYDKKDFISAKEIFKILADKGDEPSKTYLLRCENYIKKSPDDLWDGIWNLDTK